MTVDCRISKVVTARASTRSHIIVKTGLLVLVAALVCTIISKTPGTGLRHMQTNDERSDDSLRERDASRSPPRFLDDLADGDDDDDDCSKHHNTCREVRKNCALGTAGTQLINYYEFFYCTTESYEWLGGIVLGLWLLTIFSLLASTADNFFVEQLETMSEKLRLSPAIAGITLCAVGNSSPDVFSDLAAVQNADDFALALGELMGAALFLTTVVLGSVILTATTPTHKYEWKGCKLSAKKIVYDGVHGNQGLERTSCGVNAMDFVRDVAMFSIAIVLLLIFSVTGQKIYMYEAAALICVYLLYIAVVVGTSYIYGDRNKMHRMESMPQEFKVEFIPRSESDAERRDLTSMAAAAGGSDAATAAAAAAAADDDGGDGTCLAGLDWETVRDESLVDKIVFIVEYPFSVLRWASIASSHPTQWDRRRRLLCCTAPVGTVAVVFLDFSGNWQGGSSWDGFSQPVIYGTSIPIVGMFLMLGIAAGAAIFFTTNDETLPRYQPLLLALAFVSTIAWLDLIGNEAVAVLEALGAITGLTDTPQGHSIMGMTVLAWANSIGDFVSDTAIARKGQVKMAVAATFGSPLLTACIGLGLATLVAAGGNSDHSVPSKMDGELWISYIFVAISLGSSLVVITLNSFQIPRNYAYYLFAVYSLYILFSVLNVLKVLDI